MQQFDFMIVGQGIAGSLLAYELSRQNKKIILIDNNYPNSCSRVAAGLFNPVTGRKMVKTWMADTIFPHLHAYYTRLEQTLHSCFFHPLPLVHIYGSVKEANDIAQRLTEENIEAFLHHGISEPQLQQVKHPLGYAAFTQTGWCNTREMLAALKKHLQSTCEIADMVFEYDLLEPTTEGFRYQNINTRNIVFCEGTGMLKNPYFNFLPMAPVKGEILTIHAPELKLELIAKQHSWIIPVGNDHYRVGATFNRDELTEDITDEGRTYLETRLKKLIHCNYSVTDQQAGVRPSVKDRRPLVGVHPQFAGMYIFNGMGAKGISLVPYLAGQLVDHILNGTALHPQISLDRFATKRSRDLQ